MRTLVWFRGKDLRVHDHLPLIDAAASGDAIPLFVLDPYFFAPARAQRTPHRIQFLLESLVELEQSLLRRGSRLHVVAGKSAAVVPRLAAEWQVDRVTAYAWVAPIGRERDRRVAAGLTVPLTLFEGETLLAPGTLRSVNGTAYSVFSAFARAFHRAALIHGPAVPPARLPPVPPDVRASTTPIPTLDAVGVPRNPQLLRGGEAAARARLRRFLEGPGHTYHLGRDRLDREGTSRLSCDLKFGTLSIRTVWSAASRLDDPAARQAFLNELVWREFMHSTLFDRPELSDTPFRNSFAGFPWRYPLEAPAVPPDDATLWDAWVHGLYGLPGRRCVGAAAAR